MSIFVTEGQHIIDDRSTELRGPSSLRPLGPSSSRVGLANALLWRLLHEVHPVGTGPTRLSAMVPDRPALLPPVKA